MDVVEISYCSEHDLCRATRKHKIKKKTYERRILRLDGVENEG